MPTSRMTITELIELSPSQIWQLPPSQLVVIRDECDRHTDFLQRHITPGQESLKSEMFSELIANLRRTYRLARAAMNPKLFSVKLASAA